MIFNPARETPTGRHSREGGNPHEARLRRYYIAADAAYADSRLRGNDGLFCVFLLDF
jgi:hypothetical protein